MRHKAGIFSIHVGNHCKNQWLRDVRADCSLLRQCAAPECGDQWGCEREAKSPQLGHGASVPVWHQWLGPSILQPCLMPPPAKYCKERENKISNLNDPAYTKSELLQPPPLLHSHQSTCLLLQVC